MGKSSKPLKIVALPPCGQWEELDKLEKQGHKVIRIVEPGGKNEPLDLRYRVPISKDSLRGGNRANSSSSVSTPERQGVFQDKETRFQEDLTDKTSDESRSSKKGNGNDAETCKDGLRCVSVAGLESELYISYSDLLQADIILGERCWRMTNQHKKYLPLAIKEARMLRYKDNAEKQSSKRRAEVADELDLSVDSDEPVSETSESDGNGSSD